jgi:hypothetical protein
MAGAKATLTLGVFGTFAIKAGALVGSRAPHGRGINQSEETVARTSAGEPIHQISRFWSNLHRYPPCAWGSGTRILNRFGS